jgi:predicted glycosyltransferase
MRRRVMFYVQNLLGIGHLKRASVLAGAMAASGLDVTVVLGGVPVAGFQFPGCSRVLLPPARALDETFRTIVDEDGQTIDDGWRDRRLARLLMEFDAVQPDVLLIEQFPFGRRQFRFELLPLLESARTRPRAPKILCSLRDVLVQKQDPTRVREMIALAQHWFDRILVHGDPALLPLDASFPAAGEIADRIAYTGYVADEVDIPAAGGSGAAGQGEVIVSAGGGAVAEPLMRAALAARPLTRLADAVWRLITGPNLNTAVFDDLAWNAPPGVVVERWRPDLPVLLANCALSVSQAGYNTILDILQARARALVVPFAAGNETEQLLRARALARQGVLSVVEEDALSPKRLASAIDKAVDLSPRCPIVDINGANAAARIVARYCAEAHGA